ncbi:arylamine N-acetyltransferase [Planctomycetota bacterium]
MTATQRRKYLSILGVEAGPPSRAELANLIRTHVLAVPFENISKLYYAKVLGEKGLPTLDRYLEGIARHNFGGTCSSNNYYLFSLLGHLGYEAKFCGSDMSQPDSHTVIVVSIDGGEFLVDVGYGAPFFAPLPLDLDSPHTVGFGGDRYVLKPRDQNGYSRLELHRDGKHAHGYLVKPYPIEQDQFASFVRESFMETATFMNGTLLVRYFPDHAVRLHNFSLTESTATTASTVNLASLEELVAVIVKRFGITEQVVRKATAGMQAFRDVFH